MVIRMNRAVNLSNNVEPSYLNWRRAPKHREKAMSKTTVFKQSKFHYEEMSGAPVHNTTIARIVSPASSETLGGGIVIFEKCSYDWTVTYDEIFYIIDGQLRVVVDGENFDCETGDVIWLPRDTPLRYETEGKAVCFYAIYPGDGVRWDLIGLPPLPPGASTP